MWNRSPISSLSSVSAMDKDITSLTTSMGGTAYRNPFEEMRDGRMDRWMDALIRSPRYRWLEVDER
jgi:kynureninase